MRQQTDCPAVAKQNHAAGTKDDDEPRGLLHEAVAASLTRKEYLLSSPHRIILLFTSLPLSSQEFCAVTARVADDATELSNTKTLPGPPPCRHPPTPFAATGFDHAISPYRYLD